MGKLRIKATSARWLDEIDQIIRRYNIRGRDGLAFAASDALSGLAYRKEVDDLVRRRLLRVEKFPDEYARIDPAGSGIKHGLCGRGWDVLLTERAMRALWPTRLEAAHG